jgi:hypothetical protein
MSRNKRNQAAAAPAAAPKADEDSFDSLTAAPVADADGDGHDDATGQFVEGNPGRPSEEAADPVTDDEPATDAEDEAPAAEATELVPVFALNRINGKPAERIFTPDSIEQLNELRQLGAVRNLTAAEAAIFGAQSE